MKPSLTVIGSSGWFFKAEQNKWGVVLKWLMVSHCVTTRFFTIKTWSWWSAQDIILLMTFSFYKETINTSFSSTTLISWWYHHYPWPNNMEVICKVFIVLIVVHMFTLKWGKERGLADFIINFSNEMLFYPAVYVRGRNVMDISPHNFTGLSINC